MGGADIAAGLKLRRITYDETRGSGSETLSVTFERLSTEEQTSTPTTTITETSAVTELSAIVMAQLIAQPVALHRLSGVQPGSGNTNNSGNDSGAAQKHNEGHGEQGDSGNVGGACNCLEHNPETGELNQPSTECGFGGFDGSTCMHAIDDTECQEALETFQSGMFVGGHAPQVVFDKGRSCALKVGAKTTMRGDASAGRKRLDGNYGRIKGGEDALHTSSSSLVDEDVNTAWSSVKQEMQRASDQATRTTVKVPDCLAHCNGVNAYATNDFVLENDMQCKALLTVAARTVPVTYTKGTKASIIATWAQPLLRMKLEEPKTELHGSRTPGKKHIYSLWQWVTGTSNQIEKSSEVDTKHTESIVVISDLDLTLENWSKQMDSSMIAKKKDNEPKQEDRTRHSRSRYLRYKSSDKKPGEAQQLESDTHSDANSRLHVCTRTCTMRDIIEFLTAVNSSCGMQMKPLIAAETADKGRT